MALPTFFGYGTPTGSTGAISPPLPVGWQENDAFLLLVETDDQPVGTPSGWQSLYSHAQPGATRLQVFGRRATSSESAPSIADAGDHQFGIVTAFRGCAIAEDPWHVIGAGSNGIGNTGTCASITTTDPECLIVCLMSGSGQYSITSWTNANLTNLTERIDVVTTAGNDGTLALATGEKVIAGSTGATSVAIVGTNPGWDCAHIALQPPVTWRPKIIGIY